MASQTVTHPNTGRTRWTSDSTGTRFLVIGSFYRGGSFPRVHTLVIPKAGESSLELRYTGGSFHSYLPGAKFARELAHCDAQPPDDGIQDHHAFALALRGALADEAPPIEPDPAPVDQPAWTAG